MVVVAMALLQKKVTVTSSSLGKLVGLLQGSAKVLSKSSKFAKLIMELCKSQQYQEMVSVWNRRYTHQLLCTGGTDNFSIVKLYYLGVPGACCPGEFRCSEMCNPRAMNHDKLDSMV